MFLQLLEHPLLPLSHFCSHYIFHKYASMCYIGAKLLCFKQKYFWFKLIAVFNLFADIIIIFTANILSHRVIFVSQAQKNAYSFKENAWRPSETLCFLHPRAVDVLQFSQS
jgi:hypothetical protein